MGKSRVEAGGVVPGIPKALAFGLAGKQARTRVVCLPAMKLVRAQRGARRAEKPRTLRLELDVSKAAVLFALGPARACAHERPSCAIVVGQALKQVEEANAARTASRMATFEESSRACSSG